MVGDSVGVSYILVSLVTVHYPSDTLRHRSWSYFHLGHIEDIS